MEQDDMLDQEKLRNQMDAEIKRVSELFRFVMKYQRHFQPSGVEFSGLRQYLPSDDASRIDWKNSAGKPELYVKQYEEEVDMDVFIVMDASDTMMFGTGEKLKSEYAAMVSAALVYASVDAGIDAGFAMYGGDGVFISPKGGNDQYQRVLDEVTNFDNYGGTFNLEDALNDVIGQVKENTAIFVISDLIEVEGDYKNKMVLASKKFRHLMTVMTRDLRDYKLPRSGNVRLESPSGGGEMVVYTDRLKKKFDEEAQRKEKEIEDKIESGGSSFLKIDTRKKFATAFAEYFSNNKEEW